MDTGNVFRIHTSDMLKIALSTTKNLSEMAAMASTEGKPQRRQPDGRGKHPLVEEVGVLCAALCA